MCMFSSLANKTYAVDVKRTLLFSFPEGKNVNLLYAEV